MARIAYIDKVFAIGTQYRAETDKAFAFRWAGTDQAARIQIKVDGAVTAEIHSSIAPLAATNTNVRGPHDLQDLMIVVPPNKLLEFAGAASGRVRLIGTLLHLMPGENLPGDLLDRFREQNTEYSTYLEGTFTFGTNEAWAADRAVDVITFRPSQGERWFLRGFFGVAVSNLSAALDWGQVGIRLLINDQPLDVFQTSMGRLGIDARAAPLPPTMADNFWEASLENYPIELSPAHAFKVQAINISGGSLTPPTGSAISVTARFVAIRRIEA